jgi:hypothetical protein
MNERAKATETARTFRMDSGLMLPLIKSSLPDFGAMFEAYADDLKRVAEGV